MARRPCSRRARPTRRRAASWRAKAAPPGGVAAIFAVPGVARLSAAYPASTINVMSTTGALSPFTSGDGRAAIGPLPRAPGRDLVAPGHAAIALHRARIERAEQLPHVVDVETRDRFEDPIGERGPPLLLRRDGRGRPLGDLAEVAGDTLWVDLAGYMARHYPPGRMVISYAVMRREGGELRHASPGVMHWIADPVTGPRPTPPRPDTNPAPGRR